ncbi:MAG: small acid-soluble spore protein Tlp [Firmicutes bacterium]|nr:small acid-soluble spore protein Tlp [Bacillota bacterium]
MAKPDDRSDNAQKLQRSIANTAENLRESKDFLKAHEGDMHPRDIAALEAKNSRREDAIAGFREEIRDEVHDAQNHSS